MATKRNNKQKIAKSSPLPSILKKVINMKKSILKPLKTSWLSLIRNKSGQSNVVMQVVVLLVVIGVSALVVFSIVSSVTVSKTQTETFDITNPAVNQTITITYIPKESTIVVSQYNGTGWTALSSSNWSLSGKALTVYATALDNGGGAGNTTTKIKVVYDPIEKGTFDAITSGGSTVFNLLVVMAIVITASAIIGVVYYSFGKGGGGAPPTGF